MGEFRLGFGPAGALAPVVVEYRAAITEPQKIGALLRSIDGYIGHPTTAIALKLSLSSLFVPAGSALRNGARWTSTRLNGASRPSA